MKPKQSPQDQPTNFQLFQSRLENMINPDHSLVHLAAAIRWERFDEAYSAYYCQDNGAPGLPTRLMVGLQYLKYTFNLSDEELVKRWLENPYWQYFCGEVFFQTDFPCDDTSLGIWRKRIGADALKLVLEETIRVATEKKFVSAKELSEVIVDTTVQEKNITFPTDAKLLSRALMKIAKHCLSHKIKLRQSYSRLAKRTAQKASEHGARRRFGKLKECNQTLKNWLGRVLRDIEKKRTNKALSANFLQLIEVSNKLLVQEQNSKKKIYSLHESEVCCIGKGKDRVRYEFGQQAAIVKSNSGNWIVNVEDLPDNPYAGHTLALSIEGAEKITGVSVKEADVDKGYRGHDYKGSAVIRIAGTRNAGLRWSEKKRKRRRSSIEPVIGHLKSDHRLDRCFLKGRVGDKLNLIGSAAGFNVRKLLSLLGTGIFSRALLFWEGLCRFRSSLASRFGVFTSA
ncbi:MAG: IS5 family transposase [Planctomycetaceae bacterium]|nr:IS5 family transposase [Planctomycetaceae bacterium]